MRMTRQFSSLVIGADSGIGRFLFAALKAGGTNVLGTSRRDGAQDHLRLDLADDLSSWPLPGKVDAAFICAAMTSTESCRRTPHLARRINVDNTVLLANRLAEAGAFVVFPSTNLVFDGERALRPAADPPCPHTEYGRLKADAEKRILALGKSAAVVRLTKVLPPDMELFSDWKRSLLSETPITPYADMPFAPLSRDFVAQALLSIAAARGEGIWHVSPNVDISYAEAARLLCRFLNADDTLVRPISWRSRQPDMEHVPTHTTLDASRLADELNLTPRQPTEVLLEAFGGTP